MSTKYTPGPWSVFAMGDIIAVEPRKHATGKRPNIVDWPGFDSNEQSRARNLANARLIAAAPELVEAWREYFEAVEELATLEREGDYTKRFDEALMRKQRAEDTARRLLARIDGEEA